MRTVGSRGWRPARAASWAIALAAVCGLGLWAPAWATLLPTFSVRGLTFEAHAIVRGEVLEDEVVYDAAWGRVYTHTVVRVSETLSGGSAPGDLIVVRQMGGALDGVHTQVVGTAPLLPGDEVVLFARTDGAFHYLIGMSQGAFRVDRASGAEAGVSRSTHALNLLPAVAPAAEAPPEGMTLAGLRAAVTEALAELGGGR